MRLIDADRINFYKATVARGTHSFDNVEIVEKSRLIGCQQSTRKACDRTAGGYV